MQEAYLAGVSWLACQIISVCAKVEVGKLAEEEAEAFTSIVKKQVHTVMFNTYSIFTNIILISSYGLLLYTDEYLIRLLC